MAHAERVCGASAHGCETHAGCPAQRVPALASLQRSHRPIIDPRTNRNLTHSSPDLLPLFPPCRKLDSIVKEGSVSKYVADHLPRYIAVVVVRPPEGHDWGNKG